MQYLKPQRSRWKTSQLVLIALVGVAILMGVVSAWEDGKFLWQNLMGNLATELIGAVITYLILDQLIGQRENEQQLKEQLIREMGSRDNGIAARAMNELRARGWLQDGSLKGWFFQGANWQRAYLKDANLQGVGVFRSDLSGARLTEDQLMGLNDLRETVLSDGSVYDGRYCLKGDLDWAYSKYGIDVRIASPQQMADYYAVPLERYLEGQRWAKANLPNPPSPIRVDETPSKPNPRWLGLSIVMLVVAGLVVSLILERRQ